MRVNTMPLMELIQKPYRVMKEEEYICEGRRASDQHKHTAKTGTIPYHWETTSVRRRNRGAAIRLDTSLTYHLRE